MSRRGALSQLSACLQGVPPAQIDWAEMLKLANTALITPQLFVELERAGVETPPQVRLFLMEVANRNRDRNRRTRAQLVDALAALNGAGIQPVLLKGLAVWATAAPDGEFDRMLGDIDLLVRPAEAQRAIEVLVAAGFGCDSRYDGPAVHVVAELGRPTDVGFIDLHQRPPGPPGLAEIAGLEDYCKAASFDGFTALLPSPTIQTFLLILHDQIHDGDYWRGGLDLRHLLDLALLSRAGIDWGLLDRLCGTRLIRNAAAAQLIAAAKFAGADIPERIRGQGWARLQYQRHMAQFAWPKLSAPMAALGAASEWKSLLDHRAENRRGRARVLGTSRHDGENVSSRMERFRHILTPAAGKL